MASSAAPFSPFSPFAPLSIFVDSVCNFVEVSGADGIMVCVVEEDDDDDGDASAGNGGKNEGEAAGDGSGSGSKGGGCAGSGGRVPQGAFAQLFPFSISEKTPAEFSLAFGVPYP